MPDSSPSSAPTTVPNPRLNLRLGDRGEDVRRLQFLLITRGVARKLDPDGVFGPYTQRAVVDANIDAGSPTLSIVEPALLTELGAMPTVRVEVPRVRTMLSLGERRLALAEGHRLVFGTDPSPGRHRMILAQVQAEHGRDNIWVNNLGNVMADAHEPFFRMRAKEVIKEREVDVDSKWVACALPREGAAKLWLRLRDRWPDALGVIDHGSPAAYAKALKEQRDAKGHPRSYYSDSLAHYTTLLSACWRALA